MSRHPVLVFVALAFGWSWSLELGGRALGGSAGEVLRVAAKFGPSLAGLAAAWLCGGRAELRALVSQALRWRVAPYWYLIAVLGPLLLWWVAFAYVAGVQRFTGFDPAGLALFPLLLARHFALGGGLGEELGWRGFLQSALERSRGVVAASLAIGAIWGLWHAPVFVLPTEGRTGGVVPLGLFTVLCMAYSLIFARVLHRARDSVLVVALLHASTNAAEKTMRTAVPSLADSPYTTLIYAGYVLFLAVAALFARGAVTDSRRRRPG